MAVRIRLRRMGTKKKPFYRVVVADSRSPRDGRFLDTIGTYDPRTEPAAIRIDHDKAMKWLADGADPTDSARSLLSQAGIWQEFKTGVAPEPRAETPLPAEPRPTPATPAERTAPEPEVEPAPESAEEIEREEAPAPPAASEAEAPAAEAPEAEAPETEAPEGAGRPPVVEAPPEAGMEAETPAAEAPAEESEEK